MLTKADYFTFALDLVRRQFPTPRLVDRAFPVEVEERAIRERNDETIVRLAREALLQDTIPAWTEPSDPRRI